MLRKQGMKLLISDGPTCTVTSTAMLLNVEPRELIQEIGHDGLAICWPEYTDDRRFRGHCIAEVQDCCLRRGRLLAPIFVNPYVAPDYDAQPVQVYERPWRRITDYMKHDALVIGMLGKGVHHAVAYNAAEGVYYDPRGYKIPREGMQMEIKEIYIVAKI